MPMLITFRIGLPVNPVHSLSRTRIAKAAIRSRTAWTSRTTSWPSTIRRSLAGARRAVWRTARSSVVLMRSPANIAARRSSTPAAWATFDQELDRVGVARCFE